MGDRVMTLRASVPAGCVTRNAMAESFRSTHRHRQRESNLLEFKIDYMQS